MKKSLILCAIALFAVGCTPNLDEIRYNSEWAITNSTDRTLVIAPPYGRNGENTLQPGETKEFYYRQENLYRPYFEMMMVRWRGTPKEEISFDVLSTDGELLNSWSFASKGDDIRAKHFFHPASWKYMRNYDRRLKKWDRWVFEILETDLRVGEK
jgi:hypothetical protein